MSDSTLHRTFRGKQVHVPYSFEFANATAREAPGDYISTDLGKFALQLDDESLWMLTAVTPSWKRVGIELPLTTKGDILTVNADGDLIRLPVGADNMFLSAVGGLPVWAALDIGQDYLAKAPTVFTANGTYTVPAGITKVVAQVQGAGGGSGGSAGSGALGGKGGGPGGYIMALVPVTPDAEISVIVGTGGAGGQDNAYSNGGNGGTSAFGSGLNAVGGYGGEGSVDVLDDIQTQWPRGGHCSFASNVIPLSVISRNMMLPTIVPTYDNGSPLSLTPNTTYNLPGKLYGGGASFTNGNYRTGQPGANGIVRIWEVEG